MKKIFMMLSVLVLGIGFGLFSQQQSEKRFEINFVQSSNNHDSVPSINWEEMGKPITNNK